MASATTTATEVVTEYIAALNERDLDRAVGTWRRGGVDHISGSGSVVAPDELRDYWANMFEAVPDLRIDVVDVIAADDRVVVRLRGHGTFSGSGKLDGLRPNGKSFEVHSGDVFRVEDGKIVSNHDYANLMEFARQVGALPPSGSPQERVMAALFNARTALRKLVGRG